MTMYQQSVIMQGMCTSAFENEYSYPTPWIHGSNRQSPPPPLMTKQEQPMGFQENTNALMSPLPSCTNQHQYYYPQQHQAAVSPSSTPTWDGGYYSGHHSNTMCQPLVMDDYASNVSSPDLANGPLILPPSPNDVLSSTSSPTIDDQWMDLCSPTTHSSYYVEHRHSFDDAIRFATNTNTADVPAYMDAKQDDGVYYYHSGNNAGTSTGSNMMGYYQMNSTIPSPTPSSSSISSSAAYQPTSMMITRHQSVPSLYYPHQHHPSHHYRHHHHHHHPHQHLQHQHPIPSPTTVASDVRPYQCHICSRSFARKHDLQRHIRVHTGDKPYTCLCCKKAFARTDALKRHLRMEEACRNSPQVQAMKITGKRRYKNL